MFFRLRSSFTALVAISAFFLCLPLVANAQSITAAGIFSATNGARTENGQKPLVFDKALSEIAEEKLDDLFEREYFDHTNPNGETAGTMAKQNGYRYALLGENLAMGWYEDSGMVVDSWMDSPGHRKNILHEKFTAIGIAVDTRMFQGEETLIAVQVFARPLSLCATPSNDLKNAIVAGQSYAKRIGELMNAYVNESSGASHQSVRALTNQVSVIMAVFMRELDAKVRTYNTQVKAYEKCVRAA